MSTLTKHAKIPLRLMPVGGSITYGQCSSDGNGYRKHLRNMLVQGGYEIEMVGSRKTGSMSNNDHEGWRGYRVEQIMNKAALSVSKLRPNVFAVNAGSNDCLQWFEMGGFQTRMERLLDVLWKGSPHSTVLLSTLLVMADERAATRLQYANEALRRVVQKQLSDHKRIVLVEMQGGDGPLIQDLSADGVHPNDDGYEKMARKWLQGVQAAARNRFI